MKSNLFIFRNLFYLTVLFSFLLVSCEKDAQQDLETDLNEVIKEPTVGEDFSMKNKFIEIQENTANSLARGGGARIIDVRMDLNRPGCKKGPCKCGLGVCQLKVCIPSCGAPDPGYQVQLEYTWDELIENPEITLELEASLDEELDHNFYVDISVDAIDDEGNIYRIPEGVYEYNKGVGEYGGYVLPFYIESAK